MVHSPALLEAVELLKEKGEVRPYFTYDFGRMRDPQGFSIDGDSVEWARETLAVLFPQMPAGVIAFVGTHSSLDKENSKGVELVLTEGKEPWDILRADETAPNLGVVRNRNGLRTLIPWLQPCGVSNPPNYLYKT